VSHNWEVYFCRVNDKLASIRVDLGIRELVPDTARPWLLWVWVYFKMPRPDGLSSREEFNALGSIEDYLESILAERCDAVLSGLITTEGRREFYFYGKNSPELEAAIRESLREFDGYKFDLGEQRDPDWNQYLNVLYPSEEDFQRLGNRKVLETLTLKGDKLEVARHVRHWAYFDSQSDRERFRAEVERLGYHTQSESEIPDKRRRFCIQFRRMKTVELDAMNEAVLELFRAAKKHRGEYDGWECEVVAGAPENTDS